MCIRAFPRTTMDNRPSLYYLRPTFPNLDFLGLIRVNGQKCRFRKRRKHSGFSSPRLSSRVDSRGSPIRVVFLIFANVAQRINPPLNRSARSRGRGNAPEAFHRIRIRADATGNHQLLLLSRGCRERGVFQLELLFRPMNHRLYATCAQFPWILISSIDPGQRAKVSATKLPEALRVLRRDLDVRSRRRS